MADKLFILYDGRACGVQGTDEASVLATCDTENEAKNCRGLFGAMACYSYNVVDDGATLVDEKWEWDYFPPKEGQNGE